MFTFSFSNKFELIYVVNEPTKEPIGSLLRELIDVDWSAIEDQMIVSLGGEPFCDEEQFAAIKDATQCSINHPAIAYLIDETSDIKELADVINRLEVGSRMISYVLESLVDEEQSAYEERLMDIINSSLNLELKTFFDALGVANMLSVKERNKPLYHAVEDFPFLFETKDIMTLATQELQYMCSNRFYIRKCGLCKKFIWTRKMNKTYCDRTLPNTKKTCSQLGPTKVWADNNPKAYSLYWTYRKRLFNRATKDGDNYCYHQWLCKTETYRDRARKDEIRFDEMKAVLDEIEAGIYNQVAYV